MTAFSFRAVSISTCASFSSQSTSISSNASSACALLFAMTTATGSPCHLAVLLANGVCSGDLISPKWPNVPTQGLQNSSISLAVYISNTPEDFFASSTFIDLISA